MTASLRVRQSGPFVSVQDAGRFGFQRYGVTESGPMDRLSFKLANFAIGNALDASAIEISLGGIEIECISGSVLAAISGGKFNVTLSNSKLSSYSVFTLDAGSVLSVRPGEWGSWCYLALAAELESPEWLGSQSVHLNTGLCGNQLQADDIIELRNTRANTQFSGEYLSADSLKPGANFRVVMGPQDRHFNTQSIDRLLSKEFRITPEYNRMGARLSGPGLTVQSSLDMPSEPIARGSLQVPGHGDPIVLMADHQTTGGYPKIATMISCDQDKFAQLRVGDLLRFQRVAVPEAIQAVRVENTKLDALFDELLLNRVSLEERLANSNLIGGVVDAMKGDAQSS